jgi:hypothetical protein
VKLANKMKRSIIKVRFKAAHHLLDLAPTNPHTGKPITTRTITRALHSVDAISVRVRKCQMLGDKHKVRRVAWCEKHLKEGTDFATWTFSDEKWWCVGGVKGNERLWVCASDPDPEERYVPTAAHPAKVMIWGAISYHGKSAIHFFDGKVKGEQYQDAIKQAYLPACFDPEFLALSRSEKYVFQQDGARCHTSKDSVGWLKQHLPKNIKLLEPKDWPASSPDLSPIETLWAILQDKVIEERAYTQAALIKCVEHWWWEIPQEVIQHLYESMPTRIGKCLGAEGGRFRI